MVPFKIYPLNGLISLIHYTLHGLKCCLVLRWCNLLSPFEGYIMNVCFNIYVSVLGLVNGHTLVALA